MLVQSLRSRSGRVQPPPPLDTRIDRPARRQVGAVCWRRQSDQIEVLLVTSRETGRWIIPKGNRMAGLTDPEAAAEEAWEEAGVRGNVGPQRVGSFHYMKRLARGGERAMAVDIYALRVRETLKDWPERRQRTRLWFTLPEAAEAVDEPELKALIACFEP
jgi:8-oxo-dGTP pyrophosphatase MutT (NUDIX family)